MTISRTSSMTIEMAGTGNKNLLERKCDKKVMTTIAKDRTRKMLKTLKMSLQGRAETQ